MRLRRVFVRPSVRGNIGEWRSTGTVENIVGVIIETTQLRTDEDAEETLYRVATPSYTAHSDDAWLYASEIEKIA